MTQQRSFRINPLLAAVVIVAALFAVLFAVYGINRWMSSGEVIGRVEVAGAQLGGLTPDEARVELSEIETDRLARTEDFNIDGETVALQTGETGFRVDTDRMVAEAMAVGREGNFANQFLFWLTNIFSTTELDLSGHLDQTAMETIFDDWDTQVIDQPADLGSVGLVDGELAARYPTAGVGVDRAQARDSVLDAILSQQAEPQAIPTAVVQPELTAADVDAALDEAGTLLSAPVTMTADGEEWVIGVDDLKAAFVSETVTNSAPRIVNSFDPAVVDQLLEPVRSRFEAEPVDARFEIDGENVNIVPGLNGTRIDEVETAKNLFDVALTTARTGVLPVVEGAEPAVTTDYLESLNVKHLVSQFTTYHACCEARVTNIHLMADAIDGAIVLPGQTFSINDHVGERTEEKGYLPAGSIVGGEIVDTFGGGVSQFATTFYNAVFWGGYQDVDHKPHSYYFSRYPEGIEATLFWRSIDLKFRNNREHAVLIHTSYTDTSITVSFYGFNDGRTLSGNQSGGVTSISVVHEGGPNALHVKGEVSDRYNVEQPGDPEYRANPGLSPDTQKQVQSSQIGWAVTVHRTITVGDGTVPVEEQEWVWRYRPQRAIIEVNPCRVPGSGVACPTTTTTTTSTTVPSNSTTSTTGGS